ncbi:unnamed protein product [Notodromas monacha]|uniref:NAD(+) kinase n=1 Tax=Notodromas monacha TaxID=399045 RepID=A0A7R9BKT3_9CRUS|nr:unnamed protein product [Notodromas monacha]CAG0917320.1 unnamed protein product [Notodromas monacha]
MKRLSALPSGLHGAVLVKDPKAETGTMLGKRLTIQDPASQRLTWYKPPLSVLVIKKVRDASVLPPFIQLVTWLMTEKRMVVCVESSVMDDPLLAKNPAFGHFRDKLMTFREGIDDLTDKIDFIICLGGDGTLLYASSLFQQSVPPVMAFHLGSLGFLTPFEFENFQDQVHYVLEGHAALTLRSRLRCIIMRKADEEEPVVPGVTPSNGAKLKESNADVAAAGNGSNHHHHHHHHQHLHQHHHNTQHQHHNHGSLGKHHTHHPAKPVAPPPNNLLVLNEVVIDRGPSPYLCNIDLFLDGKQITSVQGDDHVEQGRQEYCVGLLRWSTPTGIEAWRQLESDDVDLPSAFDLLARPNRGLVRVPG